MCYGVVVRDRNGGSHAGPTRSRCPLLGRVPRSYQHVSEYCFVHCALVSSLSLPLCLPASLSVCLSRLEGSVGGCCSVHSFVI